MDKKTALEFCEELAKLMRKRKYRVWSMEAGPGPRVVCYDRDGKSLMSFESLSDDGEPTELGSKEF